VVASPEGAPVLLYTKQKSKDKIVVAMKKSDFETFRDVEFAFQVTGIRDGFEKQEVIISEEKLFSPEYKSEWEDTEVGKKINALGERSKARQLKRYQDRK
jgi:hypothetical protein